MYSEVVGFDKGATVRRAWDFLLRYILVGMGAGEQALFPIGYNVGWPDVMIRRRQEAATSDLRQPRLACQSRFRVPGAGRDGRAPRRKVTARHRIRSSAALRFWQSRSGTGCHQIRGPRQRGTMHPCRRTAQASTGLPGHLDDDLAFRTSCFDVSQGRVGRFKRKDPIHDRADASGIDERADLVQLFAVGFHEQK